MPADVAQPPRTAGSIGSSDQQSSSSSSLRLGDERDMKSLPPSSSLTGIYLQRLRRRSEYTETGSIGYGLSAPLEFESSYSSHPGYPTKPSQPKSPCNELHTMHLQQYQQHHSNQNQQTASPRSARQLSSTPSSRAYVDLSLSTKLPGCAAVSLTTTSSNDNRRLAKTITGAIKSRTIALSAASSTTMKIGSLSTEAETSYVIDSEMGNVYLKGQLLGKGGFARVYLITEVATRKQYACKIISKHQMQKIHMQKIAREIMIHKELNHENVVQMHHYFEDSLNVYMLLEACPKKSLVHVLKYRGKVTEPEARYYMKQMVNGVAYIHSQKVIHRDLKPGNMFLSERMIVKIGDFGLATQPDNQRRRVTLCGTPNFIAPEVLFKHSYSYEADVWALGCILYALLVGQTPFDSTTLKETYARICSHRYKELDDTIATSAGQDLVRWLLQPIPELRATVEHVKKHPYLTKEYVPASLPDSCCYQVPRLSFVEKTSAFESLPSTFNFSSGHDRDFVNEEEQVIQQHMQQPQSSSGLSHKSSQTIKKSKVKGKKKVSSWLASWRLPKLPRFRRRISSVMCLEARKKQQQQQQGDLGPGLEGPATHSQQISKALEKCLAATGKGPRSGCNPPLVHDYAPLFVTKWIDYSNKYGLAFQLSDKSVGVLFNDSTKMSYTYDRRRVEYMTTDGEIIRYNRERNIPIDLQKKLDLLRHFTDYMDKHLTEGGEITEHQVVVQGGQRRDAKNANVPIMHRWLRTSKTIVMELNVPLVQMNFLEDHTKLIVSQQPRGGYFVTYIDGERRASTYQLDELRDSGCSPELHDRLLYIYKVTKEFAELDTA